LCCSNSATLKKLVPTMPGAASSLYAQDLIEENAVTISQLIAIDGGGSGSRALLANTAGEVLARIDGPAAALSLGIEAAVGVSTGLLAALYAQAGIPAASRQCCAVFGMAGAHHPGWRADFLLALQQRLPELGQISVVTDGDTSLAGAHAGQPGALIAIGTGLVGEALLADGQRLTVSGWGFPSGDEGSGAWLGLRAMQHAQQTLDRRAGFGELAKQVLAITGISQSALFDWLGKARAGDYARLAPAVLASAKEDAVAEQILKEAAQKIACVAQALDPSHLLPLALLGGLAEPLLPSLPADLQTRRIAAAGDALDGALLLARQLSDGTAC